MAGMGHEDAATRARLAPPDWWKEIVIESRRSGRFPLPRYPIWYPPPIDQGSLIKPKPERDWLVNPGTAILFDGVLIGPTGQPGLRDLDREVGAAAVGLGPVNVNPGSDLAAEAPSSCAMRIRSPRTGLKRSEAV